MHRLLFVTIFAMMMVTAGVVRADQGWQVSPQQSTVSFVIHSTLHEVKGRVRDLSGSLQQGEHGAKGFMVIGVSGLTTELAARDTAMYGMFDLPRHPQINFIFDNTDLSDVLKLNQGDVVFMGVMTIHDVSHPITITAKTKKIGDALICEGRLRVHLKDYGLKPPSSLFGMIRVNDDVDVVYSITFIGKGNADAHV